MTIKKAGYTKTFETQILRTKHLITLNSNTRKIDLVEMLKNVPDGATVDEVLEDDDGYTFIEFHEEKRI